MQTAFIVDGLRTAIGSFCGSLSPIRPDDLLAHVIKNLVQKHHGFDAGLIDDVYMGCANQAGEDNRNVARMSVLLAGLPVNVPAETVNRLCASGLSAAVAAARAIQVGEASITLAGGVESMTRGPWVMSKTSTPYGRDAQLFDSSFGWRFINNQMKNTYGVDAMGQTAENVASQYAISRQHQDAFACWSQQKAMAAQLSGRLAQEIIGVEIPQKKGDPVMFNKDEFIKGNTTVEGLAKLKPSFKSDGSVTAGNASGLNDGAAALLLASETAINQHGFTPLARILASATTGVAPRIMGIGPVAAANLAMKRAGLNFDQLDVIELNEAFAAQALACTRAWGLNDNDPRINPNGGAIAIGHPLGMSGARILYSAALQLQLTQKKHALVTMCIGVGQGYAVVIEKA